MRAGQPQLVAQEVREVRARFGHGLNRLVIH
jgi:hypothetical protein